MSNSQDKSSAEVPREDGRHLRVEHGRRAAVDAAVALLAKGRPVVSIDQLAEESGLSRRTLFRYFGGVDGIIDEMMAVYLPVVFSIFGQQPTKGSVEQRVRGLLTIHLQFVAQFGHIAQSIDHLTSTSSRASEMKALREETFRRQTEAWLLSEFKSLPPEITTQVLILTSFNTVSTMHATVGDKTVDALTRTIVRVIKNG